MNASNNCQLTIGVYIPTKNRLELLKKAIDSVLSQSYQNFKICVVDDGSTDGTFEYLSSLSHPSITFIRNEQSIGACAARNKAIESLDTDLVTGLDDDDVFLPTRLEDLIQIYDEKFAFVCSGYFWDYGAHKKSLFAKSKVISLSDALDLNPCSNQILVNRERVLSVNGFDPKLPALQDHDLWVRLIAKFGAAYRLGKELYVVNDDRGLERVSSVDNKLEAISIFRSKHKLIMSERNQENLNFYEKKTRGERVTLKQTLHSVKFGMPWLKVKHMASYYMEPLFNKRLHFLREGKLDSSVLNFLLLQLAPLVATGGPGAVRIILLSLCVWLFGSEVNASFSKDIFLILILNIFASQSWGFYFYNEKYRKSLRGIALKSSLLLLVYPIVILPLFYFGAIDYLSLSLLVAFILHYYFLLRFKLLAERAFLTLACIESILTLVVFCLTIATFYYSNQVDESFIYQVYAFALLIGTLFMAIKASKYYANDRNAELPKLKSVLTLSFSNLSGAFAIFSIPAVVGVFAPGNMVTAMALAISFCSLSFLMPRVYLNKQLPDIGMATAKQVIMIEKRFIKIVFFFALLSSLGCSIYLYLLVFGEWKQSLLVSFMTSLMMFNSQLGQVYINKINLLGGENRILKAHIYTVLLGAVSVLIVLYIEQIAIIHSYTLYTAMIIAFSLSFIMRKIIAKNIFNQLVIVGSKQNMEELR